MTGLHALESTPLVTTRWQPLTAHAKAYLRPEETRNLNIHFVESSRFSAGRMSMRPVIPATCATVSLSSNTIPPKKLYRIASQMAEITLSVSHHVGFCSRAASPFARPEGSPIPLCPPRPTHIVFPTSRKLLLSPHGPQARSDGQRDRRSLTT